MLAFSNSPTTACCREQTHSLCVCVCMFFFLNCAVNGIEIGSMAGFGPVEEGKGGGRRSSARDMSVCVCLCVCETE